MAPFDRSEAEIKVGLSSKIVQDVVSCLCIPSLKFKVEIKTEYRLLILRLLPVHWLKLIILLLFIIITHRNAAITQVFW